MATTADIRNGLTIEYNNGLYTIVEFQHVKPGKGPAFVRTKLKNVVTGNPVTIQFHAELEQPLTCTLPTNVILKVTYTEPGIKGDTATNASKRATLETGAEIFVPLFIETDEVIKVNTTDGSYVERVK